MPYAKHSIKSHQKKYQNFFFICKLFAKCALNNVDMLKVIWSRITQCFTARRNTEKKIYFFFRIKHYTSLANTFNIYMILEMCVQLFLRFIDIVCIVQLESGLLIKTTQSDNRTTQHVSESETKRLTTTTNKQTREILMCVWLFYFAEKYCKMFG